MIMTFQDKLSCQTWQLHILKSLELSTFWNEERSCDFPEHIKKEMQHACTISTINPIFHACVLSSCSNSFNKISQWIQSKKQHSFASQNTTHKI